MISVVIKSVDEAYVRKCMDAYAAQLVSSNLEVEEIAVFGSFANGDFAPGSDIDVFPPTCQHRREPAITDQGH